MTDDIVRIIKARIAEIERELARTRAALRALDPPKRGRRKAATR